MTQRERDKLQTLIDDIREWNHDAELRFQRGDQKMDRILSMLEDDPHSSNKGLLSRTNEAEQAITALKHYVDERQRKQKWWYGIIASIVTGILLYFFRWIAKIENYHI